MSDKFKKTVYLIFGFAFVLVIIALGYKFFYPKTTQIQHYNLSYNLITPIPKQIVTTPEMQHTPSIDENQPTDPKMAKIILNNSIYEASKIGDKVGNLTVSEIDVNSPAFARIRFKGSIEITGSYHRYSNDGVGMDSLFNGHICVNSLDNQSLMKIPKLTFDERDVWFCFSNIEEANNLFQSYKNSGNATVNIDDYYISYAGTETFNTAKLIRVEKIGS